MIDQERMGTVVKKKYIVSKLIQHISSHAKLIACPAKHIASQQ